MAKKDNEKWEYLPEGRVRDKATGAEGVIRTIGGRRVFIKDGQDLASAMIESGKFDKSSKTKPGMRESYRKEKEKDYKEQEELYDKYKKANEETSNVQKEAHDYMKKVADNNEKYEDTYEKRKEKEDRQEIVDKQRGTEPLREQYREEQEQQRQQGQEKARKDAFDYSREEVTKAYETMRDKMQKHMDNNEDHWSGKEYTNAEFLAHLEDANWHGEMKQLREANLTPEQLTEIKDKTTLSSWGVGSELTGKENVQKMIDGVKNKSTNETMNNAIREKASNKYAGTKRWGFGYANDDNVPVYNNKIDYTGDFTHANLQTLSDSELKEALNKQTELLNKANAEKVGDRRTRNGRMQAIFNKSEKLQYNNGVNRIKEELVRRENEKYPQYKGTPYEVKYYSLEDVMKDKDSPLNQYIRNKADEKTTQELVDENKSLYKEFGGFADTGDKQKNQEVEKAHAKWLQNKTLIQEHEKQGNNYRNALTKLNDKSIKDGTYNLDTGEAVDFKGVGYNVSFEQTGDNYTNGEYYDKINECRNKCDGKVYGGKFDGTPELSFYTKNIDDAIEVAEKYNQHSVWDIEINDYYYNPFYDESKNKVGIKAQENDDWVRRSFDIYKREHPNTKINSIKDYLKMKKKK